jgi:hypothetical protein
MEVKIMRLKRYALLVVTTLALFGLVGWSSYAQKKSSGRAAWEYRLEVSLSTQQVNELGAEGWEMAGFSVDGGGNKVIYFKRAK